MPYHLIHERGCKGVVFTFFGKEKPCMFDKLCDIIQYSKWPDGKDVLMTDLRKCGYCGEILEERDVVAHFFVKGEE